MALKKGDVVLIPFPFSDLSTVKTRPAVIVSGERYNRVRPDRLLAYLSSQLSQADHQLDHVLKDWQQAKLLKPSFVRPKIAAIDPALIVHHVGALSKDDLAQLDNRLRLALAL